MNFTNFVNECRNIVWLSGYAKRQADGSMLLYQSSNEATAFPIHVPKHLRFTAPNVACEVRCHAVGFRDPDTGHSGVRLEAIQIKRAAVTAAPRGRTFLNALRDKKSAAANPFAPREEVIAEVRKALELEDGAVEMLLNDANKRIGNDGFQNRAVLSGFVGHKAYVPPTDFGSGDLGYVQFMLMQSAEAARSLIVRVRAADSRFSKELKALHPLTVIGRVHVQAQKNEAGEVVSRSIALDTDRASVGLATLGDFAAKSWPLWWRAALGEYYQQRRDAANRDKAVANASKTVVAPPVAVTAAEGEIEVESW